jgi:dTDP-4-amino-4,6-dideoxygalactose transaminase
LGFNYRVTDIQCALGLSQLGKLERFVRRRAELVARYDERLASLPKVRPLGRVAGFTPAWHLYVILIEFGAVTKSRAEVMRALRARGIGTQVHYIPLHQHPYYCARYGAQLLPGAEQYYSQALTLPLFPSMSELEQDRVVMALSEVLDG